MNKFLGIISIVLFVIIVSILGLFFHKTILDILISIDVTKFNFLIVYLLVCSIYFLFPLPVFFIILLNGYLFQNIGFYISYCLIILSSTILFFFSKSIVNLFRLNIKSSFLKKGIDIEKFRPKILNISQKFVSDSELKLIKEYWQLNL